MVRIQLIDTNLGFLDVKEGTAFPISMAVSDIRDVTQKKGTFSKTITLSGSKNNLKLLNNYYDLNIQAGTFDINKLQKCAIIQDGVVILDNMYLQLINVKKKQATIQHDSEVEFEVLVKDSAGDFFTKINGKELTDLDFSNWDVVFTVNNIKNSFNNTNIDGLKFIMPYIDPASALPNKYLLDEFKPAIYVRQYFDRIFSNAGYTYSFPEASGTSINFDKLMIPYNGDVVASEPEYIDTLRVVAEKTTATTVSVLGNVLDGKTIGVTNTGVILSTELIDAQNQYMPITGIFENLQAAFNPSNIQVTFTYDYRIELVNQELGSVKLASTNPSVLPGFKILPKIKSTRITPSAEVNFIDVDEANIILVDPLFPTTYPSGVSILKTVTGEQRSLILNNVPISSTFKNEIELLVKQRSISADAWFVRTSDGTTKARADIRIVLTKINMDITQSIESIDEGSIIKVNKFVPQKIKQSDLIKSICQMFNLFIEVDKTNPNNLIITTRDKFYDSGSVVDWTKKLVKNDEQSVQFLPDLSAKKLILTYKEDKDGYNVAYKNAVNEVYGQVEFTYDNEHIKGEQKKELIFSPTPIGKTIFGAYVPMINGSAPKTNIRILVDNGEYTCGEYKIKSNNIDYTGNTFPNISHFVGNPLTPTSDINFATCDYYFYNPTLLTNNTLFNVFWRRTINQINKGKLLTAKFNLNAYDIQNTKLNSKIRIDNSWWNINKISDYDANSNSYTTVELISIDENLDLPDFKTTYTKKPNVVDVAVKLPADFARRDVYTNVGNDVVQIQGVFNRVQPYSTGLIIGSENVVQSAGASFIMGSSNILESSAYVIGSNNFVGTGTTGVMIVGDNITASTGNTLYANNVQITSGGTINGQIIENILVSSNLWTASTGNDSIIANNGTGNLASGDYSIAAGAGNIASGNGSIAIGGGTYGSYFGGAYANKALGYNSAVVGGRSNSATTFNSFIGGGAYNLASGGYSFVGGGTGNKASGSSSFASGLQNIASGSLSFVGGGTGNIASGTWSAVIGGNSNLASNNNAIIAGGQSNSATTTNASVIGGSNNLASGTFSFVGGGSNNLASGTFSFVGGGQANSATTTSSSVVGGADNLASGNFSFVCGQNNTASGVYSSVVGGLGNSASALLSIVVGGDGNTASGIKSAVVGGQNNQASSLWSSIIGGNNNRAFAGYSFVAGGNDNFANSARASVIGGRLNTGDTIDSIVLGGTNHLISGIGANVKSNGIIAGSFGRIYDSENSVIIGGTSNIIPINSSNSVIIGGVGTSTSTDNHIIFGWSASTVDSRGQLTTKQNLVIGGALDYNYLTVNATQTLNSNDNLPPLIIGGALGANINITLPSVGAGRVITFKVINSGAFTMTLVAGAGDTINVNGVVGNYAIANNGTIKLFYTANVWYNIA